jgi:hypothetical protein
MGVDWKRLKQKRQEDSEVFYVVLSGDKDFKANDFMFTIVNDMVAPVPMQDIFSAFADKALSTAVTKYKQIKVITGDNHGADDIALTYAMAHDYDVFKYEADWDNEGSKAGFVRNEQMFFFVSIKQHKAALLFWDGVNYVTRNLIYQAYNFCIPIKVYNYKTKKWLTQEEIQRIQLEEQSKQQKYNKH